MKNISVLIPVYCEAKGLADLFQVLSDLPRVYPHYEWNFILVNDGSKDNSLEIMRQKSSHDKRYMVIDLSRNFGKEIALSAGIVYAKGDAVIIMDADLQHPPSYIAKMLEEWELGAEVVEMIRVESSSQPFFRRIGSKAFYFMLRVISDTEILAKTTDFRLLDRKVVSALLRIEERHRMFRGLVDWLGFKKVRLSFSAAPRVHGDSVYSYAKLVNLALNSFIAHSSVPLRLIGVLGAFITLISSIILVFMLCVTLIDPNRLNLTGLAFVVVINTILSGVVLLALGLMSLYISKIYAETQNRPLFVVREILNEK